LTSTLSDGVHGLDCAELVIPSAYVRNSRRPPRAFNRRDLLDAAPAICRSGCIRPSGTVGVAARPGQLVDEAGIDRSTTTGTDRHCAGRLHQRPHMPSTSARMSRARARPIPPRACECRRHCSSGCHPHVCRGRVLVGRYFGRAMVQPNIASAFRKRPEAGLYYASSAAAFRSTPMRPIRFARLARAASGQVTAAPPRSNINSRRLVPGPRLNLNAFSKTNQSAVGIRLSKPFLLRVANKEVFLLRCATRLVEALVRHGWIMRFEDAGRHDCTIHYADVCAPEPACPASTKFARKTLPRGAAGFGNAWLNRYVEKCPALFGSKAENICLNLEAYRFFDPERKSRPWPNVRVRFVTSFFCPG